MAKYSSIMKKAYGLEAKVKQKLEKNVSKKTG
jgi:hypothetical protein